MLALLAGAEQPHEETATCDEVLAAYLVTMGRRLAERGLTMVAEFVDHFRLCLNARGNEACGGNAQGVFCETNTPQQVPEVANIFISEYLDTAQTSFDRETGISLMMHLCRWLFVKHYSNLKLSLCD